MDRHGLVTFKGNGMTLVGDAPQPGDKAPDFTAMDLDLKPVKLSDFKGRNVIISSVASVDTPVCEIQTKRFNAEADKLDAEMVTISLDLPFAQKRFIADHNIDKVKVLSDYKGGEFGKAYGLYIKELGLLARAVLVIDKEGKIAYEEIVKEIAEEPNYERALEEVKKLK